MHNTHTLAHRRANRHATSTTAIPFVCGIALTILFAVPVRSQERPAASQTASAQQNGDLSDLALEDLLNVKVYAASKSMQDVAQAPASVTVVGSDEIRRHGYRTIADILRAVRGFYVTSDRDYSYVGVRGFLRPGDYNGRVLLLVNGHRMNDTIFEQSLIGTESPIDISLIERVEVIRGPSSSLYGTSAFFGVVNVITRTGRSVDGAEAEGELGSQRYRRGRFAAGGRNARGFEGLFSVTAYGTRGNDAIYFPEFDTPAENHGVAVDADADKSASVFASGTAGDFTAQVSFGSRTKTIPTAAFDTVFNDPRTWTKDVRGFADLEYSHQLNPLTRVELRGSYDIYDYSGDYAYDTGIFTDAAHGAWATTEGMVVRELGSHSLTMGAEYRHNFRQNQSARDETGALVLDDRRRSETAAVFAEDQYRITPRVLVNAGVRWDEYFGIFGGTVNPRVGLIVTGPKGRTLKALYGRSFRAPNPFELYYEQSPLSAKLQPERIQTFELDLERRLSPHLLATISAFRNHVSDIISLSGGDADTLDGLYYRNADQVTAKGVELELQGELPWRVHARLAQVFQTATLDATSDRISNSPRATSTIVVDAPIPGTDAVVAFNGYFIGQRDQIVSGIVESAFVSNVTISRRLEERRLGVGLTIYNLFGAQYGDPGSVEHRQGVLPQDGRTAAVRMSWRF